MILFDKDPATSLLHKPPPVDLHFTQEEMHRLHMAYEALHDLAPAIAQILSSTIIPLFHYVSFTQRSCTICLKYMEHILPAPQLFMFCFLYLTCISPS